jgi:hypothetical protein
MYSLEENSIIKAYNVPQFDNGQKSTDTVYSDRLMQWDFAKHDELCQKHFGNKGQIWSSREPEKIEAFLRDYTGNQNIVLCRVEELENKHNGYPYWRFDFKKNNDEKK